VCLGLAASFFWGLADFLGGVTTRQVSAVRVVLISQAIGLCAVALLAVIAGEATPESGDLAAAAIAGLTGAVGLGCFYQALAVGTMSVVAPVTATAAIVPVVIGLGDGDHPGSLQLVGMGTVALGVLLVTQDGETDPDKRRASRTSVGLALIAALSIGLGFVCLERAADSGPLAAVMWARVVSVALLLLVAILFQRLTPTPRSAVKGIAGIGIFDAAATALYAWATTEGLLSVVGVAASLYPVTTVLLARTMLREHVRPIQGAGIVFALSGIALVAAGAG
jgi:drug/metabolite transporter (DMT)-like permease